MFSEKILTVGFTLLMLLSCGQNETTVKGDWSKYEIESVPHSDHKKAMLKNTSGEIIQEGFIKNGVRDGQWTYYNPQQNYITKVEHYINGRLNGVALELNRRHELETRSHYKGGQRHGYYVKYHRSRPKTEAYYKDGQLHGRMTKYHDYSDQIMSEAEYRNGQQHGIYRYYDEQGNITLDYLYENGKKVRGGIVE
ncbi:MAG: hypothetical protein R3275_05345 [Saprospiraceae bacterium]|nr:hypothetical protein [Saprospiraceae bacterium]